MTVYQNAVITYGLSRAESQLCLYTATLHCYSCDIANEYLYCKQMLMVKTLVCDWPEYSGSRNTHNFDHHFLIFLAVYERPPSAPSAPQTGHMWQWTVCQRRNSENTVSHWEREARPPCLTTVHWLRPCLISEGWCAEKRSNASKRQRRGCR